MEKFFERYAKIPTNQRYALATMLAGVFIVLYVFMFHSDQSKVLTMLEKNYQSMASERAEKSAYIQNLSKYETRLTQLKSDLEAARSMLPDDPDVPQLLSQLANKGRQTGLAIDSFEPRGETRRDFFAEIAFAMQVRGSYHEIATFIDSVGKMDRIVNVSDISLKSPRSENQKVVLEGSFTIKTYRFLGGTTP